ncbi:hypothetical protein ABH906_000411 [Pseudomonas frederiksbergensis]
MADIQKGCVSNDREVQSELHRVMKTMECQCGTLCLPRYNSVNSPNAKILSTKPKPGLAGPRSKTKNEFYGEGMNK